MRIIETAGLSPARFERAIHDLGTMITGWMLWLNVVLLVFLAVGTAFVT